MRDKAKASWDYSILTAYPYQILYVQCKVKMAGGL